MQKKKKLLWPVAAIATLAVSVAGCAGGIGSSGHANAGDTGFEHGASQEDVERAIEDLEPVTIVFQGSAASPESTSANSDLAFKEAVEARSGGKITVEIAWGQSIASLDEVGDALVDGRLDVAVIAPGYSPAEYPTFDALTTLTQFSPSSPVVGEIVSSAMLTELAWSTDDLLAEFEDKGLVPLSPMVSSGEYYSACTEAGTSESDWAGRQVRVGNAGHLSNVEALGATPVSMDYTELFDALQRGAVNCTLAQLAILGESGVSEVAPNLGYLTEGSFVGRSSAALLAGSSFEQLPVAYQQILFDAVAHSSAGVLENIMQATHLTVENAITAGGEMAPFDPAAEDAVHEAQLALIDKYVSDGRLTEDQVESAKNIADEWSSEAAEMNYADEIELAGFAEHYTPGSIDFLPVAERVFEEAMMPHRPAA